MNGTTYQNEAEMPPDVRAAYERATHAMSAQRPTVKKNELTVSFAGTPMPIETRKGGGGIRAAFILAAFIAGGLLFWLLMRAN